MRWFVHPQRPGHCPGSGQARHAHGRRQPGAAGQDPRVHQPGPRPQGRPRSWTSRKSRITRRPNTALSDGSLDANYYQHLPWFEDQVKTKGYKFGHGEGVHIEPYAAFSEKVKDIKDIQDGAKVAITNDPSNQVRALKVLQVAGLVKDIKDDSSVLTLTDEQNPKKLKFSENQPELLINDLKDPSVDLALINGNFILKAGLSTKDALAVESVENNPYANFLAWREDSKDDVRIKKLDELLHSPEVKAFIEKEWPNGDVTVAF